MIHPEDTLFIVIEGIDGCGKDTQLQMLSECLRTHGREPVIMTDPGTTLVGEKIRELVLDASLEMPAVTQMLLYMAARASMIRSIGDARRAGCDVLCGRWSMSTVVYQGYAQRLDRFKIEALHKEWVRLDPDVYIVIDIPARVGLRRRKAAAKSELTGTSDASGVKFAPDKDRFESRGLEFAQALRSGYRLLAEDYPNAWIVDGDQDSKAVHTEIINACRLKSVKFPPILR